MENKRLIFIGDVHSCLPELKELINKVNYNPSSDRVILLGDLTDRGLFPIETIRYVKEMKFDCVRGNHDQKILNFFSRKINKNKYPDYYNYLSDEDILFIKSMPLYLEFEDIIAVHGGIKNYLPLDKQGMDIVNLRFMDSSHKFISLKKVSTLGIKATGAKFWTEFGPFSKNVVYGHHVHSYDNPRIDTFENGNSCYGIDCGICFGGHITALIWPTKEIVQVKGKEIYCERTMTVKD